jgi:hypothetical protein
MSTLSPMPTDQNPQQSELYVGKIPDVQGIHSSAGEIVSNI